MIAMYAKFVEDNEWEGETWNFYIPISGNEAALSALADALKNSADGWYCPYLLGMDSPIPEFEVDVLVKHSDVGYMAYHNKLVGRLVLTGEDLAKIGSDDDPLYKGGIRDFMHEQGA